MKTRTLQLSDNPRNCYGVELLQPTTSYTFFVILFVAENAYKSLRKFSSFHLVKYYLTSSQ